MEPRALVVTERPSGIGSSTRLNQFSLCCHQLAVADLVEAVRGAKIIIFVIPHQFIGGLCDQMKAHLAEGAIGISLIKVRSSRFFGRVRRFG